MRRGWTERSIDELAFVGRGKSRHRPRNEPSLYGGEHPFVQTAEIHNADLWITSFRQTYSDSGLAQSKMWPLGTICITNAGENTGDCAILGIRACFPDSVIAIVADESRSDTVFLKYAIDQLKPRLRRITRGATQDNLSVAKLTSFTFPAPPLEEQRQIGAVLGAYGDLIENNRRRIQLLEQAARLLYKEWFVHLRFPGHEHVTITDGVPDGWEKKPLSEFCTDVRESVNPKDLPPETAYIGLEHIPRRSITLNQWGMAGEVDSNKFEFAEGDILFGKIRPYFHKVGFAIVDGIASSDAIVIRSTESRLYHYALFLLSSDEFVALASKTVREGSKMPRADWKHLLRSVFKIPPRAVLALFSDTVAPICDQLRTLALLSRQLTTARDLLLPRLMNGEVMV